MNFKLAIAAGLYTLLNKPRVLAIIWKFGVPSTYQLFGLFKHFGSSNMSTYLFKPIEKYCPKKLVSFVFPRHNCGCRTIISHKLVLADFIGPRMNTIGKRLPTFVAGGNPFTVLAVVKWREDVVVMSFPSPSALRAVVTQKKSVERMRMQVGEYLCGVHFRPSGPHDLFVHNFSASSALKKKRQRKQEEG
jgi:hypothetical protein